MTAEVSIRNWQSVGLMPDWYYNLQILLPMIVINDGPNFGPLHFELNHIGFEKKQPWYDLNWKTFVHKTSSKNLTSHLACCELFPCCSMRQNRLKSQFQILNLHLVTYWLYSSHKIKSCVKVKNSLILTCQFMIIMGFYFSKSLMAFGFQEAINIT